MNTNPSIAQQNSPKLAPPVTNSPFIFCYYSLPSSIDYLFFLSVSFTPFTPFVRKCSTVATAPTLAARWICPTAQYPLRYLGTDGLSPLAHPKPRQAAHRRVEERPGAGPLFLDLFLIARPLGWWVSVSQPPILWLGNAAKPRACSRVHISARFPTKKACRSASANCVPSR